MFNLQLSNNPQLMKQWLLLLIIYTEKHCVLAKSRRLNAVGLVCRAGQGQIQSLFSLVAVCGNWASVYTFFTFAVHMCRRSHQQDHPNTELVKNRKHVFVGHIKMRNISKQTQCADIGPDGGQWTINSTVWSTLEYWGVQCQSLGFRSKVWNLKFFTQA